MGNKDDVAKLTQVVAALTEKVRKLKGPRVGRSRARGRPTEEELKWSKETRRCPICKHTKPVLSLDKPRLPDFGIRTNRDVVGPQSYCRACRNGLNYYGEPRAYKSKRNP